MTTIYYDKRYITTGCNKINKERTELIKEFRENVKAITNHGFESNDIITWSFEELLDKIKELNDKEKYLLNHQMKEEDEN